jgi:23S rRNA (pseudouridine1915-N3)-methyltransferase
MKVTVLTLGNKMPAWVEHAVSEFSKRLQEYCQLSCVEIPLVRRTKSSDMARILDKETTLLLEALPAHAYYIALDRSGEDFDSEQLSQKLEKLQHMTSHLCFILGGPEGLSPLILDRCHARWSLSQLTFPHTLARIVLLEAIYRAWSILKNHPYHK